MHAGHVGHVEQRCRLLPSSDREPPIRRVAGYFSDLACTGEAQADKLTAEAAGRRPAAGYGRHAADEANGPRCAQRLAASRCNRSKPLRLRDVLVSSARRGGRCSAGHHHLPPVSGKIDLPLNKLLNQPEQRGRRPKQNVQYEIRPIFRLDPFSEWTRTPRDAAPNYGGAPCYCSSPPLRPACPLVLGGAPTGRGAPAH